MSLEEHLRLQRRVCANEINIIITITILSLKLPYYIIIIVINILMIIKSG